MRDAQLEGYDLGDVLDAEAEREAQWARNQTRSGWAYPDGVLSREHFFVGGGDSACGMWPAPHEGFEAHPSAYACVGCLRAWEHARETLSAVYTCAGCGRRMLRRSSPGGKCCPRCPHSHTPGCDHDQREGT